MAEQPDVRIPPPFLVPLTEFAKLPSETRAAIVSALAAEERTFGRRWLTNALTSIVGHWTRDQASRFVEFLLSLNDLRRFLDLPDNEAAARVVTRSSDFDLEETEREGLAEALTNLLNSRAVSLVARGADLASEHEHTLDEARILTDIRPLFRTDSEDDLDGAVITHSLRLRYTGREGSALHIALDADHLRQLQKQVERAIRKAARLEQFLSAASLPHIEPDSGVESK